MSKRPSPCTRCRVNPKVPGQGKRFCEDCYEARKPIWEQKQYERAQRRVAALRAEREALGLRPKYRAEAPAGQAWCPVCEQFLPVANFGKNAGKKDGLAAYCKPCYSAYFHDQRLRKIFGITAEQYQLMLIHQGGRCFICQNKPRKMRLAVDHDHKTGEVRGLLCKRCNQSVLGAAHDNVDILRRAVRYLENPPSREALIAEEGEAA